MVFLVAYPAAGELAGADRGTLRSTLARAAAAMEWRSIGTMARQSLVFAYGNDLAARVRAKGASRVYVTFTSLVDDVSSTACREGPSLKAMLLFAGRFSPRRESTSFWTLRDFSAIRDIPFMLIWLVTGHWRPSYEATPLLLAAPASAFMVG